MRSPTEWRGLGLWLLTLAIAATARAQPIFLTYDADNRLTNWSTAGGSVSPTYDANGNLTNDGSRAFTWDARGRLTAIAWATRRRDINGNTILSVSLGAHLERDLFRRNRDSRIRGDLIELTR